MYLCAEDRRYPLRIFGARMGGTRLYVHTVLGWIFCREKDWFEER
jgi:hypothetical protein